MTQIVCLANDPNQVLYYKDSIPRSIRCIQPNAAMMLNILEKQLKSLNVPNLECLYCVISWEVPKNPVFYPTPSGITNLYEKSQLIEWLNTNDKNKSDPCRCSSEVQISDYITPCAQELFDYVIQSTGIQKDVLVRRYQPQPKEYCCGLVLNSIFNCIHGHTSSRSRARATIHLPTGANPLIT